MNSNRTIGVHIVDDSAVMRQTMTQLLTAAPGIEVIDSSPDPIFAQKKMALRWPDVILLDVEMPRMDGITFLKKLMTLRPTPVVVCSTLTTRGAEVSMEAMAAGAVSCITKPRSGLREFLNEERERICCAIREAAATAPRLASGRDRKPLGPAPVTASESVRERAVPESPFRNTATTERLIAIGTSTGGTAALEYILTRLPRTLPGIVVVQHMPEKFTTQFAKRLNGLCQLEVIEAGDNERILPGRVLIAPGGRHLQVRRTGAQYRAHLSDGPPVQGHRPSVDVLFESLAAEAGGSATGFLLTGMGADGARGLLQLRQAGGMTLAQDEATSLVFGMPRAGIELGAAMKVIGLDSIPGWIVNHCALTASA